MKELLFIATVLCWFMAGFLLMASAAVIGTLLAVAALVARACQGMKVLFGRWTRCHRSRLRAVRQKESRR